MDLGKLRKGEWLMAAASVALLVVLFLPWFGVEEPVSGAIDRIPDAFVDEQPTAPGVTAAGLTAASAWGAFTVWDLLLVLLAAMGLGAVLLAATRRAPAAPVAALVVTTGAALVLAPVLLGRIVFPPGPNALVEPRYGAWLGLLCVIGIAAGAWTAMADERTEAIEPPFVPAQPTPPEVAPAGSVVAEGRVPSGEDDRD